MTCDLQKAGRVMLKYLILFLFLQDLHQTLLSRKNCTGNVFYYVASFLFILVLLLFIDKWCNLKNILCQSFIYSFSISK